MVHRLFEINSDNPFFWLTMLCEICYFRRSGQAVSSSRRALSTSQVTIKTNHSNWVWLFSSQDLPLVLKSKFGLHCNFDQYLEWEVKVSHGRLNEVKRWRELSWIFSGHREDYSWVARFLCHSGEKEVRSVHWNWSKISFGLELTVFWPGWLGMGSGNSRQPDSTWRGDWIIKVYWKLGSYVCLFVCLRAMVIWSKWVEIHDGKEKFSLAINVVFPNCDQFNRFSPHPSHGAVCWESLPSGCGC